MTTNPDLEPQSDSLVELFKTLAPGGRLPLGEPHPDSGDSPVVAKRKAEILEAALHIFAAKGFEGSRTKEIAQEAKVSEATIFKYFPTKRHLLYCIMRPVFETVGKPLFLNPIGEMIRNLSDRPLEEILCAIIQDRYDIFIKNSRLATTAILEASRNPEAVDIVKQMVLPEIIRILLPVFQNALAKGEVRSGLDPLFLVRTFMIQVVGFIAIIQINPEPFGQLPVSDDIKRTVELFVRGLAPINNSTPGGMQ